MRLSAFEPGLGHFTLVVPPRGWQPLVLLLTPLRRAPPWGF